MASSRRRPGRSSVALSLVMLGVACFLSLTGAAVAWAVHLSELAAGVRIVLSGVAGVIIAWAVVYVAVGLAGASRQRGSLRVGLVGLVLLVGVAVLPWVFVLLG